MTFVPGVAPPITALDLGELSGWIAFSAGSNGNEDIYVVRADGSGLRRLTTDPGVDMDPSWSPDGKRIAWRTLRGGPEDEIFVMQSDGSGAFNLTANPAEDYSPAWAPDGSGIAFASDRQSLPDLWLIDVDGGARRQITGRIGGEYPSWSADASRLVYVVDTDSDPAVSGPRGGWDLFLINADGAANNHLTSAVGAEKAPSWSPDGASIVFEVQVRDHDRPDLWLISPDGSSLRQLTFDGGYSPAWSADSNFIVYSSHNQLGVISVDGTRRAYLATPGLEEPVFADWTR